MTEQGHPTPFPRHLLNEAPSSRLDYFKAYTVAHPALKKADQAVWNALREPAGAALVFVVGPTGVGKTTLLTQIEKRLIELASSQGNPQPSSLPTLRLDAVSPALTQFKWGGNYSGALEWLIGEGKEDGREPWHEKRRRWSKRTDGQIVPLGGRSGMVGSEKKTTGMCRKKLAEEERYLVN
jgi:hypothetical protein